MVGGKLQFPGWDDDGDGQEWARQMRALLQARDADATVISPLTSPKDSGDGQTEVAEPDSQTQSRSAAVPPRVTIHERDSDSDDSLEGYASESPSSRAPSPPLATPLVGPKPSRIGNSPSSSRPTIEEINEDPTLLNPLQKKIQKPVYLLDLGRLLKVEKEGNEQFESIQVALNTAASLIRKKARWGLELGTCTYSKFGQTNTLSDENAVDLTHSLIGLQNNYEIEDFDHKVLEALTVLVACSPRKSAL
jgi:telomere length regulation protein